MAGGKAGSVGAVNEKPGNDGAEMVGSDGMGIPGMLGGNAGSVGAVKLNPGSDGGVSVGRLGIGMPGMLGGNAGNPGSERLQLLNRYGMNSTVMYLSPMGPSVSTPGERLDGSVWSPAPNPEMILPRN